MNSLRPLLALQTTIPFDKVLVMILNFHLRNEAKILDITPGEKHSWRTWLREEKKRSSLFFPRKKFYITWIEEDLETYRQTKTLQKEYDAIFFDPPYIFGLSSTSDIRSKDYGEYFHSFDNIQHMFEKANKYFPKVLITGGKLFLKYSDVFSLQDRKFYFLAQHWGNVLFNFKVIDHYIIQHHHISPTAYQVKERPCGIVNYTYLTVFEMNI